MSHSMEMDARATDALWAHTATSAWTELGDGVRRQLLAYGPELMMVAVDFPAHARGALHHHPHVQVSYVVTGRFEVTIGDTSQVLEAGDSFRAPSGVLHGVFALEAGRLVDVFTPAREDFLPAAR